MIDTIDFINAAQFISKVDAIGVARFVCFATRCTFINVVGTAFFSQMLASTCTTSNIVGT